MEPDKGPHEAVVALPRRDPGVGAHDAADDFALLLHVRVLHEERAADLGLAAHLRGRVLCASSVGGQTATGVALGWVGMMGPGRTVTPHCRMDRWTMAPSFTTVRSAKLERSATSSTSALATTEQGRDGMGREGTGCVGANQSRHTDTFAPPNPHLPAPAPTNASTTREQPTTRAPAPMMV